MGGAIVLYALGERVLSLAPAGHRKLGCQQTSKLSQLFCFEKKHVNAKPIEVSKKKDNMKTAKDDGNIRLTELTFNRFAEGKICGYCLGSYQSIAHVNNHMIMAQQYRDLCFVSIIYIFHQNN